MNARVLAQTKPTATIAPPVRSNLLQRKCTCGGTPGPTGECEDCRKKRLQRKAQNSEFGTRSESAVPPIAHAVLRSAAQPLHADTRTFLEPDFGHDFSAVRVQHSKIIQPKLSINEPNDVYENEADRVADQVLRMPMPATALNVVAAEGAARIQLQRQTDEKSEGENPPVDYDMPIPGQVSEEMPEELSVSSPLPVVRFGTLGQRQCAGCDEEVELHRKEMPAPTSVVRLGAAIVPDAGQPLAPSLRAFFEPRYGYSFNEVRVHTGLASAESARAVNALAYTVGRDIVFGAGQYAPSTTVGRRLLAHELTHVVQQNCAQLPAERSRLPSIPVSVHATIAGSTAIQRWHANGPADPLKNTIVCDGKGGVTTQLGATGDADQTRCLKDCMQKHEESHRSDALTAKADICKGQAANTQVTFNGEQKASEIKASNVEINCIKPQLPKVGEVCKKIMQERIKQMEKYRDSFK
jgi:hypothetical protein